MARFELNEIINWLFNKRTVSLRTALVNNDVKQVIDESGAPGTVYIGQGGPGLATSDDGWLIRKIVVSGTTTTITHAIDAWDNRAVAVYT